MEREELLKYCRYYKGEEDNPYEDKDQNKAMFWGYERMWVKSNFSENGEAMLSEYIGDYASVGLALFEMHDDISVSYKALLFNRYAKSSYSMIDAVKPFKELYQKYYK